jgi:hypothetical protein
MAVSAQRRTFMAAQRLLSVSNCRNLRNGGCSTPCSQAARPPDFEVSMSSDAHPADNSEAAALKAFIAIVALVLIVAVVLGLTFGLAGIGALAIFAAGAMLVLCVVLTAG